MAFIRETLIKLCKKAQDILDRSERAWLAACEAWNEEPNPQATTATTTAAAAAEAQQAPAPAPVATTKATEPVINKETNDASENKVTHGEVTANFRLGLSTEVFVKPSAKALDRAFASDVSSNASRLILWTDASVANRHNSATGCALVFRDRLTWVRIAARRPKVKSSEVAELQAIELALDYAAQVAQQTKQNTESLRVVELFTDSQAALIRLGQGVKPPKGKRKSRRQEEFAIGEKTMHAVESKINGLQEAGVTMEFHWVPRNKLIGNILADTGAGLARLGMGPGFKKPGHVVIDFLPSDVRESRDMTELERPGILHRTSALCQDMADDVATVFALTYNSNKNASL